MKKIRHNVLWTNVVVLALSCLFSVHAQQTTKPTNADEAKAIADAIADFVLKLLPTKK